MLQLVRVDAAALQRRRGYRIGVGCVDAAAWKTDLSSVLAQMAGAQREQHGQIVVATHERHEYRRRPHRHGSVQHVSKIGCVPTRPMRRIRQSAHRATQPVRIDMGGRTHSRAACRCGRTSSIRRRRSVSPIATQRQAPAGRP